MGRWLNKIRESANRKPTKPTKPKLEHSNIGFVGFGGEQSAHIQNKLLNLKGTGFTQEMIEYGLEKWQQPFNKWDLDSLHQMTGEQVVLYLHLWKQDNPEWFSEMQSITNKTPE